MNSKEDFFSRMCNEAQEELARGKKSWREIETNTLILACFSMLTNHMASKLAKPLWFFAGSVGAGVVWTIVSKFLGIG